MVKTKKIPKLIAVLALFSQVSVVFGQTLPNENLSLLKKQAESYMFSLLSEADRANTKLTIRPLDKRLKLKACEASLTFSLSGKQKQIRRNGTIRAACAGSSPWQVFIPYQAIKLTNVLIALRDIEKGEQLTELDVKTEQHDLFQTRNASYTSPSQIVGTYAKTAIRRGDTINSRTLCSVCKGQPITIIAVGSGLELKTDGLALQDGIPGQVIRVENTHSGRTIKARIVSAGRVQINI